MSLFLSMAERISEMKIDNF